MKNSKKAWGIGMFGLALAISGIVLMRSSVTTAQWGGQSISRFSYTGIENAIETVYSIDFSSIGFLGSTKMQILTGEGSDIFHVSQIPVVMNAENSERNLVVSGNSNILGGDGSKLYGSHNITLIGGEARADVGNSNATLFGGLGNVIEHNEYPNVEPSVLLGGEDNVIDYNSIGNSIVGGEGNAINNSSKNVNILGGINIVAGGNNVIAGGKDMNLTSGATIVEDSFVFNDGANGSVDDLAGSGMFFLNVAAGVGFGTLPSGSTGVTSNGAVKVGAINISGDSTAVDVAHCMLLNSENIGLMGVYNQCLIGCTSGSALSGKWVLLDHSDYCIQRCNNDSDLCMQVEEEQGIDEYPSFCTEGLVSTNNASMCPGEGLNAYHNVVFETYLIDSDDDCPTSGDNQCAFQCNSDAHLTGDTTGKFPGVTMCFRDCQMPGDPTVMKKHNEVITAYSTGDVYCSTEGGVHETCGDYKTQLMCVDGSWYNMDGSVANDTINTDYNYSSCTLHSYTCGSEFNLTREEIVDKLGDFVDVWRYEKLFGETASLLPELLGHGYIPKLNIRIKYEDIKWAKDEPEQVEGSVQNGVRGKYTLCIQYSTTANPANQYPQNEQSCNEAAAFPAQFRYRFEGCNEGYDMDDKGVCRKRCTDYGLDLKHLEEAELYTGSNAICPDICHKETFTCYDGNLLLDFQMDEDGTIHNKTVVGSRYSSCTLTGSVCGSEFNIDQATYEANQLSGEYEMCQEYSASSNSCNQTIKKYRLVGCKANHYQSGGNCVACPMDYRSPAGSDELSDCEIKCSGGSYVAEVNETCVPCGTGTATKTHTVPAGTSETCINCKNKPKENAHYTTNGSGGVESCKWNCDAGYYRTGYSVPLGRGGEIEGGSCTECPKGYTSASGAISKNQCLTFCRAGKHLTVTGDSLCAVSCPIGEWSEDHQVPYGSTSSCNPCTNMKPENASYSSYATSNSCEYQCNPGYHLDNKMVTAWKCDGHCPLIPDGIFYQLTNYHGDTVILFEDDLYAEGLPYLIPIGSGYISTCVPAVCEGPCGTAEDGHSLTCYKNSTIPCSSASTTCASSSNSQTKTCVDGEWDSAFSEEYVYSSCSLLSAGNFAYFVINKPYGAYCESTTVYFAYNGSCNALNGYTCYPEECEDNFHWSGTGCVYNGSCFLAGTPVLTPDGSKNIEDIEVGDLVLSYDASHNFEYNKVLDKFVHENSIDDVYTFVISGDVLEATALHPFYVVGGANKPYQCSLPYIWKSAKNIKVGEQLMMSDGSLVTIDEISHRSNLSTTYNLLVDDAHTYFVGKGYLVHNADVHNPDDPKHDWGAVGEEPNNCICTAYDTDITFGAHAYSFKCCKGGLIMDGECAFGSCSGCGSPCH